MTEKEIRKILKQETKIPASVEDAIMDTLNEIKSGKRRKRGYGRRAARGMGRYMKTAAALALGVLCAGVTVYAAGRYFGLFDFLEDRGMVRSEEITELMEETSNEIRAAAEDTGEPGGCAGSDEYADYRVVEALCDDEVIYMVIEVVPRDTDRYLLIPQYYMSGDSVTELSIEGLTEGSIGDYAALNNKELLYSGMGLFMNGELVSNTHDFRSTSDGRGYYCITGTNPSSETELTVEVLGTTCTEGAESPSRCEFTCRLFNKSHSTGEIYRPTVNDIEAKTGVVLDQVEVSKTELGMYVTFHYHGENGKDAGDYFFELVDEEGREYDFMPYFAGGGTEKSGDGNGYTRMAAYQPGELNDTLYVRVRDINGLSCGPYALEKQ